MAIEITHRYTGAVLYTYEPTAEQQSSGLAMRAALEAAVRSSADLRGANLFCADLRDADLRDADLCGADLIGANLSEADLSGANLRRADLSGANLIGANLSEADLNRANLNRANLIDANLSRANLIDADLRGGVKLIGARPIVAFGPIGSRADYLRGYITDHGLRVGAGCFFGTGAEFLKKLELEHGDNEHGREYRAALDFLRVHAEIWTPDAVAKDDPAEAVEEVV